MSFQKYWLKYSEIHQKFKSKYYFPSSLWLNNFAINSFLSYYNQIPNYPHPTLNKSLSLPFRHKSGFANHQRVASRHTNKTAHVPTENRNKFSRYQFSAYNTGRRKCIVITCATDNMWQPFRRLISMLFLHRVYGKFPLAVLLINNLLSDVWLHQTIYLCGKREF